MVFVILIITIAVSGILYYVLTHAGKGRGNSWVQFFSKGKDAGFSFKEVELLRRLAVSCQLDDPAAIFWSQSQLDVCIRSLARSVRLAGGGDQVTQDFLSKLYDYRKKLEMEKNDAVASLSDTRQIDEGQSVNVLLGKGQGVYPSRIVKNTSQYLVIERPSSPRLPKNFSWNNLKISVYFWRKEDAGYVFDTEVQDEVFSKGTASLKLSHGESLFRTQKRKSIRIKTHKSAFLYILESLEPSDTIELTPGLKSILEDLSDSGCAVTVGGKATVGLRVKVQFILNNMPVCISGTVCSLEYNAERNRSLLHVEADPLSQEARNHILGEVFGMAGEGGGEDDLPFKILEPQPGIKEKDSSFAENAGGAENTEEQAEKQTDDRSGAADNAL
jgi:c-di-GMP-binding flagellar brake protein YcgR